MKSHLPLLASAILLVKATCLAGLMDVTSLTPGIGTASFTGTIDGVGVVGTLTGGPNAAINGVAPGIGFSEIAGGSVQWSYGFPIYTVPVPLGDRIGFSQTPGASARITLTFAAPMTNLFMNVAHLDNTAFIFSPSIADGLTSVTLVTGNGDADDGLIVSPFAANDFNPTTVDGTPLTSAPPVDGARSAYGTLWLHGTYSTLDFDLLNIGGGIENGNFTLQSVPEPAGIGADLLCLAVATARRRRP